MIARLLLSSIYGLVAGLIWAFALGKHPNSGLIYGAMIGTVIGLLLYLKTITVSTGGNVAKGEASFVVGMQSTLLSIAAISTALGVWIIRLVFF